MEAAYNVGDTITIEKDGDRLVREVKPDINGGYVHMPMDSGTIYVNSLLSSGWTITSVTPKPAPLPEGWYEYITSPSALTKIAYVRESGEVYLPDADSERDWIDSQMRSRLIPESALAEAKQEAYGHVVQILRGGGESGCWLWNPGQPRLLDYGRVEKLAEHLGVTA